MTSTRTTAPPTTSAGPPARPGLRPRWRPVAVLLLGLAAVVVGWRTGSTGPYLAGAAVTAIALARALRGRRGPVAAVLLLAAAVAGPWLGLRAAYPVPGAEAAFPVAPYSDPLVALDDVVVLRHDDEVLALGDDGEIVWRVGLDRIGSVAVLEDVVVVGTGEERVAVDPTGRVLWTRPATEEDLVAAGDGVAVLRACEPADEGEPARCTWTGIDLGDGGAAWEITGRYADGWPVDAGGDELTAPDVVTTSLFTVRGTGTGTGGGVEVRAAATGDVVQAVADDVAPVLVGADVLAFRDGGARCEVSLLRGGRSEWTTPFDCALWRAPQFSFESYGARVAGTFWADPVDGVGTLVVDLGDGAVRTEPYALREDWYPYGVEPGAGPVPVLGGRVEARVEPGEGLVVRSGDGARLWAVDVAPADVRSVQVSDDLVVLSRYRDPLLLHEWFAPRDRAAVDVHVHDATTGALVVRLRQDAEPSGPGLVGDRVLLDVLDRAADSTFRLVRG